MYADDTTLIFSQPDLNNVEHVVNKGLGKVSTWFKANKLKVNLPKINFCILHTKRWVFRFFLKMSMVGVSWIWTGECSKEWGHRLRSPCHHKRLWVRGPSVSWGLDDDLRFMPVVCLGEISPIRYRVRDDG